MSSVAKKWKRWFFITGIGLGSLVLGLSFLIIHLTYQATTALTQERFEQARDQAKTALSLIAPLNRIGLIDKLPLLKTLVGELQLTNQISQLTMALPNQTNVLETNFLPFLQQLSPMIDQIDLISRSHWLTKRLNPTTRKWFAFVNQNSIILKNIGQQLATQEQTWLIVFQNNNELRATGGFMGSYALVTLDHGQLTNIKIEDIYDADGQFHGFVAPPAGVKRYLSADRGLRLPDSNWSADFPTAAQQILTYFALGNRRQIQGVIAINQNLIKRLLSLTGPVYIADYQQQLTPQNFDQVLQARGRFFPGDHRKKHLLTLVFDQLIFKLPSAIKNRPRQFFAILKQAVKTKDIEAFALNQDWQQLFEKLNLTGRLHQPAHCLNLALIESNVGINKINPFVNREVFLQLASQPNTKTQLELTIHFSNQAPITQTGKNEYVDYQRILIAPEWQIKSILVNQQPIIKIDNNLIKIEDGSTWRQVGFLVLVKPKQKAVVKIQLARTSTIPLKQLCLFKQSGLPPISYTIRSDIDGKQTLKVINLENDQKIKF